jgi:hypothetical protein
VRGREIRLPLGGDRAIQVALQWEGHLRGPSPPKWVAADREDDLDTRVLRADALLAQAVLGAAEYRRPGFGSLTIVPRRLLSYMPFQCSSGECRF